jgi:hypothetical protein
MSNGTSTLEQVQRLVDRLTLLEQVRLLAYLTPRITRNMESIYPTAALPASKESNAWKEFFRIGDIVAATDTPESETLTAAITAMRR